MCQALDARRSAEPSTRCIYGNGIISCKREGLGVPIQRALEDVGVEFLPIDDVRLRADPFTVR